MNAWQELSTLEYDKVWRKFYQEFNFHPGIKQSDWPGIKEPAPSTVYDISAIYGNVDHYISLSRDLQRCFLQYFQHLISRGDWIYALDWQHPSYPGNSQFFPPRRRFIIPDPSDNIFESGLLNRLCSWFVVISCDIFNTLGFFMANGTERRF